jgi:hypothetical protein
MNLNKSTCLLISGLYSTLKLLQFAVYFIKFGWVWSEILGILWVKNLGLNTIQWTGFLDAQNANLFVMYVKAKFKFEQTKSYVVLDNF